MTGPSGHTSSDPHSACRATGARRTGSHDDEPGDSLHSRPTLLHPLHRRARDRPRFCTLPGDGLHGEPRGAKVVAPASAHASSGSPPLSRAAQAPHRPEAAAIRRHRQQGLHLAAAQPAAQPAHLPAAQPHASPCTHAPADHCSRPGPRNGPGPRTRSHPRSRPGTSADAYADPNPQPFRQPPLQGHPHRRILAQPVSAGGGHRSPRPGRERRIGLPDDGRRQRRLPDHPD